MSAIAIATTPATRTHTHTHTLTHTHTHTHRFPASPAGAAAATAPENPEPADRGPIEERLASVLGSTEDPESEASTEEFEEPTPEGVGDYTPAAPVGGVALKRLDATAGGIVDTPLCCVGCGGSIASGQAVGVLVNLSRSGKRRFKGPPIPPAVLALRREARNKALIQRRMQLNCNLQNLVPVQWTDSEDEGQPE